MATDTTFETILAKFPSFSDWNEQRKAIRNLIVRFVSNGLADSNLYIDTDSPQTMSVQCIEMIHENCKFYYIETYSPERKVLSAQLEKCINDYIGEVCFSSSDNPTAMTAVITELISQGKIHKHIIQ